VSGAVATGIQAFYSTLAGKVPVVVGVAVTNVDRAQNNAAILYGDGQAILAPFGTFASQVRHAKTAAVVYQESPDLSAGAASLAAALEKVGIEVKKVSYPPTSTDLIGPLTAAGAAGADIVIPYVNPSGCVNAANALSQVGVDPAKVVTIPVCLVPPVAAALGGDFPKWTYSIAASLPSDTNDPASATYTALFKKYGAADKAGNPWTETAFGSVMTMVRALNALGPDKVTSDALLKELVSFKGPLIMGAPTLECGSIADAPGLCSSATQFFEYDGKGAFTNASNGFLSPPR
jgi:branched-chain amino acid transport system substrate-binding protein